MTIRRTARSIGEYINTIDQAARTIARDSDWRSEIWYRGQAGASYDPRPKLYRDKRIEQDIDREHRLFTKFRVHARSLMPAQLSDWDAYFLAQHHGLQTRLLDWTESALAALFFAIRASLDAEDYENRRLTPVIWVLDAPAINYAAFEESKIYYPESDWAKYWLPDECIPRRSRPFEWEGRKYSNRLPIAILPSRSNPRITAQQGVFTLHGTSTMGIKSILGKYNAASSLGMIAYKSTTLRDDEEKLRRLGVHSASMFQDLDSLCNHLQASDDERWRVSPGIEI